jgi:lipid-binding SYLF domain-containing protein
MRDFMFDRYPGTADLSNKALGVLYMPLVTEAGFGIGGGYGRGALRINNVTVDYYSATRATVGLQIGAQQYAHALFFMTEAALGDFRASDGWAIGADARYALPEQGASLGAETTESAPVIALVFGQSGLIAGVSLAGIKYTRIIP